MNAPGFNQPRGFRPLLRDDTLPHQIRFPSHGAGAPIFGCVCGVLGGVGYSIEALAWYRRHLTEVDQHDVSYGTVLRETSGGE